MEDQENLKEQEAQLEPEVTPEEEDETPTMIGGLKSLGFGLLLFGVAYYFYSTMTSYENGEGVSMNRLLLLAYGILGKNITTGLLGVFGALVGYSGVSEMINSQKQ